MSSLTPFEAIADPTRRHILDALVGGALPVAAIADPFPVSRPAISQHLRVLLDAGLVQQRKVGRERHYSLVAEPLMDVAAWVATYRRFWRGRLRHLGRVLDELEP